jgi:lipopolysaccharide transport system ATP-binding protein
LTGRENIFLNGAILGMRRQEIMRRFDEIVAFAEIERFLDTPVKRYSSGMYVRLAFAVAAHLEPEILLVDEVLAVGDAAFQKKCLGKMGDVAKEGRTVLFVSHNMGAISTLCNRTAHLVSGQIHAVGNTRSVVDAYLTQDFHHSEEDLNALRSPGFGNTVRFSEVKLISSKDAKVLCGESLEYRFTAHSQRDMKGLSLGSSFFHPSGTCIGTLVTKDTFSIEANRPLSLRLTISGVNLAPGTYYTGFSIGEGGIDSPRLDHDIVAGTSLLFQVLPVAATDGASINWGPGWGNVIFRDTQLSVE